ncbi:MAG: Flp pilus assembly protein CpaB [Desulfarculus sp.]|nr:MAG: Flp pilus assembly protein CpaB [Desulfarculus sp.]
MKSKAPLIFLVLSVLLAGLAAWGAHRWMSAQASLDKRPLLQQAPVVVAARVLPAGHKLQAADLAVQQWPVANLPEGRFAQRERMAGRVLKGPLFKGEVVLASKLAPPGAAGGLSAVVPQGYRAMTVRVNEVIGVGGFVQPGDRVDVLATLGQGSFRNDPVSATVLENIPVLSVGEKVERDAKSGKAPAQKVKVVTLQLKPEQAETLALASNEGRVVLSLRNQMDRAGGDGRGVRLSGLAPGAAAKPAAPKPAAAKPAGTGQGVVVELIKGVKRSQQNL